MVLRDRLFYDEPYSKDFFLNYNRIILTGSSRLVKEKQFGKTYREHEESKIE